MPKFFINPPTNGEGKNKTPIIIEGEDAYHLARVLRAKPGAQITASDGQGRCYEVILTEVTPESVRGEVLKVLPDQAEPALKITLCQSILKGEKMDWVLRRGRSLASLLLSFLSTRPSPAGAPACQEKGTGQDRYRRR